MILDRSRLSCHGRDCFGGGYLGAFRAESEIFEDQGAAIAKGTSSGCQAGFRSNWSGSESDGASLG